MRRSRAVGRPSVWHKPIVDFVDNHGSARALEIRQALGISTSSLYQALAVLVCSGRLSWCQSETGNYRLLKTTKTNNMVLKHLAQLGY